MEESNFDVRLVRHQIRRGVVSQDDVDKHLNALPDDAEKGEETETRFVGHVENRTEES